MYIFLITGWILCHSNIFIASFRLRQLYILTMSILKSPAIIYNFFHSNSVHSLEYRVYSFSTSFSNIDRQNKDIITYNSISNFTESYTLFNEYYNTNRVPTISIASHKRITLHYNFRIAYIGLNARFTKNK